MNTRFNADIVITRFLVGWSVWMNDDVVAQFIDRAALDLFLHGAYNRYLTVFNAETLKYLSGDIGQLDGEG